MPLELLNRTDDALVSDRSSEIEDQSPLQLGHKAHLGVNNLTSRRSLPALETN
jgi:hypothetical protein